LQHERHRIEAALGHIDCFLALLPFKEHHDPDYPVSICFRATKR
jgi:hypothetical protein